jgi:hypothetical protein
LRQAPVHEESRSALNDVFRAVSAPFSRELKMQEACPPDPSDTAIDDGRAGPAPAWLGRWSFALGLVSTIAYYAASQGIHNFVGFLVDIVRRVLHLSGHGG